MTPISPDKVVSVPMKHEEIFAGFEAASNQLIQLLHNGTTLSESEELLIKQTIEVLRLTYDTWSKLAKSE
jgi:hypothetical protein